MIEETYIKQLCFEIQALRKENEKMKVLVQAVKNMVEDKEVGDGSDYDRYVIFAGKVIDAYRELEKP